MLLLRSIISNISRKVFHLSSNKSTSSIHDDHDTVVVSNKQKRKGGSKIPKLQPKSSSSLLLIPTPKDHTMNASEKDSSSSHHPTNDDIDSTTLPTKSPKDTPLDIPNKEPSPSTTQYKGNLRPDEIIFNCQTQIPASDVKYSMVLTVTASWDHDLKTIPHWDRIGGEILLRKYVFSL